jgi:hypothetical protein
MDEMTCASKEIVELGIRVPSVCVYLAWESTGVAAPRSTHDPTAFSRTSNLPRPGNAGIAIFPFLLLCNHRMMRSLIFSLLIAAVMAGRAAAAEEEFREELTLHPLPDGKVAAHFSFSTLLRGAVPRAPSSLGTDDTCAHISLC